MSELAATPVLIVAYRNPSDIVACLTALGAAQDCPQFEIFVCENGGPEAYRDLVGALTADSGPCRETGRQEDLDTPLLSNRLVLRLKGRVDAPLVHLGEAEDNLGYGGGVNAWLRPLLDRPGWPAAWVLNPDTEPAPDALAESRGVCRPMGQSDGRQPSCADEPSGPRALAWSALEQGASRRLLRRSSRTGSH